MRQHAYWLERERYARTVTDGWVGELTNLRLALIMNSHSHDFPDHEWPFEDPQNLAVFTTARVLEGAPVLLVTHDHEGDWQILCGTTNDPNDCKIVCFGCAYQRNREIAELADLPRGWRAWRDDVKSPWVREEKEPEEEEGDLMTTSAERRAENDKRVADDIRQYGCHVISVFDPAEKQPTFSYSVGIQEMTGAPEAIVIGPRPSLGHFMINEYNEQVRAGTQFKRGVLYPGFLKGFSIYVEPVKPGRLLDYTLGCARYYKGKPFSTVQLIYPTTSGVWPWQASASEWFKTNQVMLGRRRPNRP